MKATHIHSSDDGRRMVGLLADAGLLFLNIEDREALAAGDGVLVLAAQVQPDGRPRIGFSFTQGADIDDVAGLFDEKP